MSRNWLQCHSFVLQEHAFESSQKYKEGKFIIELAHMIKDNGWDWPGFLGSRKNLLGSSATLNHYSSSGVVIKDTFWSFDQCNANFVFVRELWMISKHGLVSCACMKKKKIRKLIQVLIIFFGSYQEMWCQMKSETVQHFCEDWWRSCDRTSVNKVNMWTTWNGWSRPVICDRDTTVGGRSSTMGHPL